MTLDHTRDFLMPQADPLSEAEPLALFFTRWLTHPFAPAFCMAAGMSTYLVSRSRNPELAGRKLVLRGGLLLVLELSILQVGWDFLGYGQRAFLQILWAMGVSMVAGGFLVSSRRADPRTALGLACLCLVVAASFASGIVMPLTTLPGVVGVGVIVLPIPVWVSYPVVPWLGFYLVGVAAGSWMADDLRQQWVAAVGWGHLLLFAVLCLGRAIAAAAPQTTREVLFVLKYPPDLGFILFALGAVGAMWGPLRYAPRWVQLIGRVPLAYYLVHLLGIRLAAVGLAALRGEPIWPRLGPYDAIPASASTSPLLETYAVTAFVIITLYPVMVRYDRLKSSRAYAWTEWI